MREFYYKEQDGEKIATEVETDAYAYSQTYGWLCSIFVKFDLQNKQAQGYEEFLDTKESIILSMENGTRAKYVGSREVDGWVELYFYAQDSKVINIHIKKLLSSLEHAYETSVVKDTKWKFYDLNLSPSQKEFAHIQSKHIIDLLEQEGDTPEVEREVEYYVYFDTPSQKEKFIEALEGYHYKDEINSEEFDNGIAVVAYHDVTEATLQEKVEALHAMLEKFGGYYEGWSTTLATQESEVNEQN